MSELHWLLFSLSPCLLLAVILVLATEWAYIEAKEHDEDEETLNSLMPSWLHKWR